MIKQKEKTFEGVKDIQSWRKEDDYMIRIENHNIKLEGVTNFEFRTVKPVEISHLYFGNETERFEDISFNISFCEPCQVRIQNCAPRCYIYLSPEGYGIINQV